MPGYIEAIVKPTEFISIEQEEVSEVPGRSDHRKSFVIPTNELAVIVEEADREDP